MMTAWTIPDVRRRHRRGAVAALSAGVIGLALTACGSSSSAATSASSTAGSEAAAQPSAAATGSAAHAGSIDVCSLLTATDASAIATKFKLASDASAKYKLMTEKQGPPTTAYPSSACQFTIAEVTSDNTGPEAIVTVGVQPAQYLDKTGTKLTGLGDEAYDEGPYVQVRAGDVILQSNQNQGASKDFINAMYKAMIPNIT